MTKTISDRERELVRKRKMQLAGNVGLGAMTATLVGVLIWVFALGGYKSAGQETVTHPAALPSVSVAPSVSSAPEPTPEVPSPSQSAKVELTKRAVINGQNVRLDLPTGGTPVGLALWFHGQGGDANQRMDEPWLNSIRAQGWAVASSDFHGNAWGNMAAVQDTKDLIAWGREQSGQPARMFIAESMGSTTSLNTLATGISPSCWYGSNPVVDLTTVDTVPGSAAEIAEAYSGASAEFGNPAARLAALPPTTKYRIVASAGDTLVPAAVNADALEAYLATSGYDVSSRTAVGQHNDPSHFVEQDLTEFAKGCIA